MSACKISQHAPSKTYRFVPLENFKKAYEEKAFDKVYSTNLTYVKDELDSEEWFVKVDCSKQIAKIIEHLNKKLPLSELLNDRKKITKNIQKIKE